MVFIQTYEYDALNRLTKITNPKGQITTFSYDAIGRRTGMNYANGVQASYSYDDAGRLLSLVHQIGAANVSTFSYNYDNVGNKTSMDDIDGTHNYLYDQLYRLVDATHPQPTNPAENFDYDPVGNRTTSQLSTAYAYDSMNRLLEDDQYTYSYDNNGNLISKVDKGTSDATTYQYDAENRLIQVTTTSSLITYQYDGMGRRIAKTVASVVTKYVYDEEDVLLELDATDQITARYTRTLAIDELISVDRDTGGDGILETTYFYHRDGLGSITAMTDNSGVVAQTYVYDGFGNIVDKTGSVVNTYTYTAREWDEEASIYYYRARFYSPELGRFLQEDPKGFDGGINFYVYVKNNPILYNDPKGLCPDCPGGAWSGYGLSVQAFPISGGFSAGVYKVTCWSSGKKCALFTYCAGLGGGLGAAISVESLWYFEKYESKDLAGKEKAVFGGGGMGAYGVGATIGKSGKTFGAGIGKGGGYAIGSCNTKILNCS